MLRSAFASTVAARVMLLTAAPAATFAAAPQTTLTATGSTLFYPLLREWVAAYAQNNPAVRIAAIATDSQTGIGKTVSGAVQLGTSDAFMSDEAVKAAPGIINVPLAIAAQLVVYNLSGARATHVKFDGPLLAAIYSGAVRTWDAPAIAALNPGVALPHQPIAPVRRTDGSGDAFIFSQYLAFSTPSWDRLVGFRTTVPWPAVDGALDATSNAAMVQTIKAHPYAVGFVGSSFTRQVAAANLGTAMLKNAAGNFQLPTTHSVLAAAAALGPRTPADERLSLVFAPGADSYPLIGYEYAIVSTQQPNAATAAAVRDFLFWAIAPCNGNAKAYLDAVNFAPLPESVRALSYVQIESIKESTPAR